MPQHHFYIVFHGHEYGEDCYMIRSDSPDLDELDLHISDPSCFEINSPSDTVHLQAIPSAVQAAILGSGHDLVGAAVDAVQFCQKSSFDERAQAFAALVGDSGEYEQFVHLSGYDDLVARLPSMAAA